jgi:hypothetical protein
MWVYFFFISGEYRFGGRKEIAISTYTWTFFSCTEALVSSAGKRMTETAASALTTSATVVKKPNTDWMRFKEECMVCFGVELRR